MDAAIKALPFSSKLMFKRFDFDREVPEQIQYISVSKQKSLLVRYCDKAAYGLSFDAGCNNIECETEDKLNLLRAEAERKGLQVIRNKKAEKKLRAELIKENKRKGNIINIKNIIVYCYELGEINSTVNSWIKSIKTK